MKHFKDRYPIMILHLSLTNLTNYHLFSGEDEGASGRVPRHQGGRGDQTFLVDLPKEYYLPYIISCWFSLTFLPKLTQHMPQFVSSLPLFSGRPPSSVAPQLSPSHLRAALSGVVARCLTRDDHSPLAFGVKSF